MQQILKISRHLSSTLRLAEIVGYLAVISVVARLRSLPTALRLVSPALGARKETPERLARLVDLAFRPGIGFLRASCWKRSAVLHCMLAKSGIPVDVVFGVRDEGGELKGHAWIERQREPFLESSYPDYAVTWRFAGATTPLTRG